MEINHAYCQASLFQFFKPSDSFNIHSFEFYYIINLKKKYLYNNRFVKSIVKKVVKNVVAFETTFR